MAGFIRSQVWSRAARRCANLLPLAVDCEFMQTTNDGGKVRNSLAQCSVVNINNEVVFSSFVNPKHDIVRRSLTHLSHVTNFSLDDLQHGMPEDEMCSNIQDILKGMSLFSILHIVTLKSYISTITQQG